MHRLHHDICGVNLDLGIYRRLQRLGAFWQEMAINAKEEQRDCKTCSMVSLDQAKVLNGEVQEEDWHDPYLRYMPNSSKSFSSSFSSLASHGWTSLTWGRKTCGGRGKLENGEEEEEGEWD